MEIRIKAPFEKLLKMEVLEAKDGFAKVIMPYRKELTNPHGFIHGGALCSLAETRIFAYGSFSKVNLINSFAFQVFPVPGGP